jgi:hypothetical protein
VTLRPKPDDVDLLRRLIDIRDSAHLAGITDDPFRLIEFNGTKSVLFSPGHTGGTEISTLGMRRLEALGLFHLFDRLPKGFTFDLVDDVLDLLEDMRVALGQPSRMGELEAGVSRAEAAASAADRARQDLEASVEAAARQRAELRRGFARRVGRWVRWGARLALGAVYIGVVVIAGYFLSSNLPLALLVGVIGVAAVLAVLDWLLRIDGFALATAIEARVIERITRWLESFDPSL